MIGCVGDDDFGRVNLDRLARDGVDVSGHRVDPEFRTGSAFVRYRPDGSRVFVFNIKHSASGRVGLTKSARALLESLRPSPCHGHGAVLASDRRHRPRGRRRGQGRAAERSRSTQMCDRRCSNLPGLREALRRAVPPMRPVPAERSRTHLVHHRQGGGRRHRGDSRDAASAVVVHKRGAEGARYFDDRADALAQPGFEVEEVDPTGAGDCFGATFVSCWLRDMPPRRLPRLRRGERSAGGHPAGTDGGRRDAGRSSTPFCRAILEPCAMSRRPPPLVSDAPDRRPRPAIASVCTAHPAGHRGGAPAGRGAADDRVLIEATCNQVNQEGGYTGMTPADFRRLRRGDRRRGSASIAIALILGGDHLGPNPWKHLPADEAMASGGGDDRGLCPGRLHEAAPRHQHGLRRRTGGAGRRRDRRARRAAWPSPKAPQADGPPAGLHHRHRSARAGRRAARSSSGSSVTSAGSRAAHGRGSPRRRSATRASRRPSSA